MINNKGYDGAKADLWSCGVILFVLMAGYLPFEEANLMALYKKVIVSVPSGRFVCTHPSSFCWLCLYKMLELGKPNSIYSGGLHRVLIYLPIDFIMLT